MLAEKSIVRFRNKRGVEMIGIVTDARIYDGRNEYSVFPGSTLPKLTPDCSQSPWFYTINDEDIIEIIKDAAPKAKKRKVADDDTESL